jgi:hypothetical protein
VSHGFQVSGLYFYGSGQRSQIVCGCDARGLQITSVDRLRNAAAAARVGAAVGSIIPRESFVGQPIHRVDLRLQQRVTLGGQRSISGFLDIFNVFDRANYGSYELRENNPEFGKPAASTNLSYAPRTLQMGFRFGF